MDRIEKAEITNDWFEKDKGFDLEAYAARSFGSFHSDDEFSRVVWRFSPAAAPTAREFEFHPKQEMTDLEDGGLLVSFEASGLVEMAWHLAKWGREDEVIEPVALREMAVAYRNVQFACYHDARSTRAREGAFAPVDRVERSRSLQ